MWAEPSQMHLDPIIINNGDTILPSQTVRNLGTHVDSAINFNDQVTRLTRTCFFHIRQLHLHSIHLSLTTESSLALVRALVLTRLVYCNGLLGVAPKCFFSLISGIFQAAARLILLLTHTSSVVDRICTGHSIESHIQVVCACVPVSPWVYSSLSYPLLHASQRHHRTLSSLICSNGCFFVREHRL